MSIGYACKTAGLLIPQIKGCALKSATPKRLEELVCFNLEALRGMLGYNAQNNIRLFRICSDVIPFASHPDVHFDWRRKFASALSQTGKLSRALGIRLSMHPGQYSVLNSPDEGVVRRAIADICYHAELLDSLGADQSSKIILHIGGLYGDREGALTRFKHNFAQLPEHARARIAIENDERCFCIDDVLRTGRSLGIPVVFDALHHQINPGSCTGGTAEIIRACAKTWKPSDGRQKIHYSQQRAGARPGVHSETIWIDGFLDFYNQIDPTGLDIMLEVKDKNLSALKCMHCTDNNLPVVTLEREWAKYKYTVLEQSQQCYDAIRALLKQKDAAAPLAFYKMIEQALYAEIGDAQKQKNALLHVWGYLKGEASASEKNAFFRLLESEPPRAGAAKNQLRRLAQKYGKGYLLDAYYFSIPASAP